jgi:copper resistance protein B
MTSRFSRPSLIALTVSLGTVTAGMASAAEPMDHSMHSSAAAPAAVEARPASTPKSSSANQYGGDAPMDYAAMGHSATQSGQMGAMDHSKMNHAQMDQGSMSSMDHGSMDHSAMAHSKMGQGGAQGSPRTTSRTPIPLLTDADREAAFPPLAGHAVHDDAINSFFLLDQLEYQAADEGSVLSWDASGWIGGDIDRLWLRSEGERTNGVTKDAEIQALWGHSIGPWWDVVGGVRQDFKPSSPQTWAAFGLQGMALYAFEAEATAFIGENGQTAARLEGDYDILLSNRLILQPTAEVNFYGKNDPERGIGSGLANTEVGLRLRYEIRREFAPYIGVTWNRAYGNTADLLREEGADVSEARLVAGIRLWF